jgi:hypothetical protein
MQGITVFFASVTIGMSWMIGAPNAPVATGANAPPTAPAAAEPGSAPLANLASLAGVWVGDLGGTRLEEVWLPAHGGNMTGCVRWFRPDGTVRMLELLTINADAEGTRLSIRHFDGGMSPWPSEAEGPMICVLEPGDGKASVFRGRERAGAVQTMTYDLQGPDSLVITMEFGDGRQPLVIPLKRGEAQAARP